MSYSDVSFYVLQKRSTDLKYVVKTLCTESGPSNIPNGTLVVSASYEKRNAKGFEVIEESLFGKMVHN